VTVSLGDATPFSDYDQEKNKLTLMFSPKLSDIRLTNYLIKIVLVDLNSSPKTSKYLLFVTITAPGPPSIANFNNNQLLNSSKIFRGKVIKDKFRIASDLTARIRKISYSGLVTIRFNEPLIVPQNYTWFDSDVLQLSVIPGVIDPEEYLKRKSQEDIESWNVTSFESQEMEI
jgi:hypothetical protein